MRRGSDCDHMVAHGRPPDHGLLGDPGDPKARDQGPLAVVGLHLAGQDTQEGGLARPVTSDKAGPATGLKRKVNAVEQHSGSVREADLPEGEDGRLHGAPLAPGGPQSNPRRHSRGPPPGLAKRPCGV